MRRPDGALTLTVMPKDRLGEYLVECLWPGVRDSDLVDLDDRARRCAADVSSDGRPVRFLGSMLIIEDEVVLCTFEGGADAVREVAERAAIPFERLLESSHSPWK
jgi:hypothetical protein